MAALPARHVQDAGCFPTWCHDHPFGRTAGKRLDAWHVYITGQGMCGHVKPVAQPGQDPAKRMLDSNPVVVAPSVHRQRPTVSGQFVPRGVGGLQQQRPPIRIMWIE